MNLGELRTKFVEFSGRCDLINSDDSDNGADFFINAGQRFLDRRIDFRKSDGRYFKKLAASEWYLKIPNCRTLEKVWVNDTEDRTELTRKDLLWLHNEYTKTVSETTEDSPYYWAPARLRGIKTADASVLGNFFNYVVSEKGNEDISGIVILPPADESIVVELWGKFYTDELSNDSDESYWSVVVPETLIAAALYRLEIFYRNTTGARDWLSAIEVDLADIDKDSVQEDTANADEMEG